VEITRLLNADHFWSDYGADPPTCTRSVNTAHNWAISNSIIPVLIIIDIKILPHTTVSKNYKPAMLYTLI